jgi:general secretion pathway protein D
MIQQNFPKALRACLLSGLVLLAGCAGNAAHRQGMEMIHQGRLEDALSALEKASREAPENLEFRIHYLNARGQFVAGLLADAQREKSAGRFNDAETWYLRALKFERGNEQALAGLADLKQARRHARLLSEANALHAANQTDSAEQKLALVLQENPRHAEALAVRRQIEEKSGRHQIIVPTLRKTFQKPVNLEFVDSSLKQVLEALARHSGLNFILDKDVPAGITITIFLRQVSVEDALEVILSTNQLRKRVLTDTTLLIYPDTVAKQTENQDLIVKSYFLANAEAKQVMAMLKTVLKAKNVFADDKLNLLIIRDTPPMIQLTDRLVATQDVAEPEVMLDVEILEVQRSRLLNLGIQFPDTLTLMPLPLTGATLQDLKDLNSSRIAAALSSATINLRRQLGDTNLLANPRIRTHNREKALIKIGDRVPIITTTSTATGFVAENVQYVDVGLKLEVEPTIFPNDEISIKLALEVSSVNKEIISKSGTISYQIGGRNAATVLRLRDGETQILGGLINDQDIKTANRLPGLGDLPVLGRLFSSQKDTNDKTELVLSITPRLVRGLAAPAMVSSELWSGTENDPRTSPLSLGNRLPELLAPVDAGPQGARLADASAVPVMRWEGPPTVSSGNIFRLILKVSSAAPLTSFPLRIDYDAAIFEAIEGVAGPSPAPAKKVDARAGVIELLPAENDPLVAAGDSDLVGLDFRALRPAQDSRITASPMTLEDGSRRTPVRMEAAVVGVTVRP